MITDKIKEIEKKLSPALRGLSDDIYDYPELGFEEFFASKSHMGLLAEHGFEVEKGVVDLETAFYAEYDTGRPGPVIAYMAEYDALPEIGHGCGHNILGTASTGAAITLRYLMEEEKLNGKVVLLGTPAEETSGGKVNMVDEGLFQDKGIDIAMMAHPVDRRYLASATSLALRPIQFEFFGKTAHAASDPHEGVNALDAAILTFNNINALREHILPTARIHGVIKEGGQAANIVPDYTRCEFYVRTTSKAYLQELLDKVIDCAKAGALATGCTMKHSQFEAAYDDLVTNETLNKVFMESIREFSNLDIEEDTGGGGSLDAGNASHVVPTIHGYFPICKEKIPGHTREFAAATKSDFAYKQLDEIINVLTLTAYRILTDHDLFKAIVDEFDQGVEEGRIIPPKHL